MLVGSCLLAGHTVTFTFSFDHVTMLWFQIGQLFTVNGPLPDLMPGVSVDVRGEDGRTPLMVHAAGDSNADLVVKLLDLGAQVDCQDKVL